MIERPALARALTAYEAPDKSVILTTATGDFLLTGAVYSSLIPLLDGKRDIDSIADMLSDTFDPAEVYYALRCLEAEGCLTEGPSDPVTVGRIPRDEIEMVFARDPLFISEQPDSSWQFAIPTRDGFWIGPRFEADGPCPACLTFQLEGSRPLALFAREHKLKIISQSREIAPSHATAENGLRNDSADVVISADSLGNETGRHAVRRRPECPECGDPTLYSRQIQMPVRIDIRSTAMETQAFLQENAGLLDPVTGIGHGIRKLPGTGPVHIYTGGMNRAHTPKKLTDITRHLRSFASGKGRDDSTARASLTGELAERYSAVFRGEEPHIRETFAALGERAIHPNEVMLFSDRQLQQRENVSTDDEPVPHCLDDDQPVEWTPVWSITEQSQKLVPTSLLYFNTPRDFGTDFCLADSNGNAAGGTREAAMLQGLLELVERDAVGIWWFNQVPRPALNLNELDDPWVAKLGLHIKTRDRDLNDLDVTTDIGIPSYAAISRKMTGSEEILFGFGAHVDAEQAALRAITELGQTLAVMDEISRAGGSISASLTEWLHSASMKDLPFLLPDGTTSLPKMVAEMSRPAEAFEVCRGLVEQRGMECLVLDQTRADVGVPAVKMIVPGLRHYRRRLAAGRLYSAPVTTGWLDQMKHENELNPRVLSF
jgi:ribosomal protein S12 methylthiotransferase accessory factor